MRQRTAHALDIHLVAAEPLGLHEYLMPLLVAEAHDLVLDGGAVARTYAAYAAVVERTAPDVAHDDVVGGGVGVSEPAGLFLEHGYLGHKGKPVRVLAALFLHRRKVYGIAVDPRGSPRLEPPDGQTRAAQAVREQPRGREPRGPRRFGIVPYYHPAVEIYARRDYDRAGGDLLARREPHAARPAALDQDVRRFPLPHGEPGLGAEHGEHELGIQSLVLLPAQRVDGGTLRRVQHLDLQKSAVGSQPHLSAESVYLPDEMSLRRAAYGGIASHVRDRAEAEAEHQGLMPLARRREGRFRARVSSAYDHHIVHITCPRRTSRTRCPPPPASRCCP